MTLRCHRTLIIKEPPCGSLDRHRHPTRVPMSDPNRSFLLPDARNLEQVAAHLGEGLALREESTPRAARKTCRPAPSATPSPPR